MKYQLTHDNMVTFFAKITCCNTPHMLLKDQLMEMDEFICGECGEPIAFKSEVTGLWYTSGGRIFE